jgi:cytochrome P450
VFGSGAHVCLGAPLARVQLQEFLGVLIERADRIELAATSSPHFQPFQLLRRMEGIAVDIVPAQAS